MHDSNLLLNLIFIIPIIVFLTHLYIQSKNTKNQLHKKKTKKQYSAIKNKTLDKENRLNITLLAQEKRIKQLKNCNEKLFEAIQKNKSEDLQKIKSDVSIAILDLIPKKTGNPEEEELECAFLYYLKKEHPLLSTTDLRHCLFVLLEYSLKETSRFLNISIASVKTSRYRARKKINISKSITLRTYLQNFNQNIVQK